MNKKLIITGGNKLCGDIIPSGSKNSALACIAAASLPEDGSTVILKNVPHISDTVIMCQIVRMLGKQVSFCNNTIAISGTFQNCTIPPAITKQLRSSLYFLGVLLTCKQEISCGFPGGDQIGTRPIDIHVDALSNMGVHFHNTADIISAKAPHRLKGQSIYLKYPSVVATCNIIIAASKADGKTIIINAAREPEIVDLCNLLTKMGICITGAGTECITIYGSNHIHGNIEHEIIPDRIETGTLAIISVLTRGNVTIRNCIPPHNIALLSLLSSIGTEVTIEEEHIHLTPSDTLKPFQASMTPYPGLATDLQPLLAILATQANGTSTITDFVFPERFQYMNELQNMGAQMEKHLNSLILFGNSKLKGNKVTGNDIRAVTALICAGLIAKGTTEIDGLYHLYRGYPDLEQKLMHLGANITIA